MQNNISNNSNISFKSNIRFVPSKEYKELLTNLGAKFVGEMWNINSVSEIKSCCYTDHINQCIAGVLKIPNGISNVKQLIFHWFPDRLYENTVQNKDNLIQIGKKLEEFSKVGKLKGFIIGGTSRKCHVQSLYENKLSIKLFNFLKKPFKLRKKDNFTIFFSQKTKKREFINFAESDFIYSKKNDTYYVNCSEFLGSKEPRWEDILEKNDIRNHFDFIHVADDDKVFIGSDSQEQIPNEFWNKNEFAKSN